MTEEELFKAEKLENFKSWIHTIDERVFDWLVSIPNETKLHFDFSIDSLDKVEEYLFTNY